MISRNQIEHWFTHHPPILVQDDPDSPGDVITVPDRAKITRFQTIREAGKQLALTIFHNSPACPDQSAAIRKVREAVMFSIAAVACEGK